MIRIGRRGAALLVALAGVAAFGGGVGIAALTAHRPAATAALVLPTVAPSGSPTPSVTRSSTPSPTLRPTPSAAASPSPGRSPSPTPRATPTPTPTPTPRVAGGADVEAQVEAQVVILTNQARADAGCAALRVDPRIASAAQAHSDDMAKRNYFEHDSLDGRTFADRLRAAGYPRPGAENIAFGQRSASEVMAAWLDSPGHRRNILDCDLVAIGVGYNPDGTYWTQDFGR